MVSAAPVVPDKFGRYEVQGVVGEGSMGRVYRAFDPLAQRVVAIKTLKSEYLTSDTRDEYLKRFRREAQAAGALSHPHIVTIFDVGDDFFVMELLEGTTLQALLRERGRLELGDALKILAPVADALDFAHTRGTIHRDIKPGNIAVLPDGRPKIMDFGVAHLTSTVMTAAGQFLGSPSYMAPEQIMKSDATPATDLFSLSVVSYEMLTGRKPFEGDSITTIIYKVVNELPPPPRKWNGELPPRFDDIFAHALDKDPARRYPTALAFTAALEMKEIEAVLPSVALPASLPIASLDELPPAVVETHDFSAEEAARTIVADYKTLPPLPRRTSGSPWVLGLVAAAVLAAGYIFLNAPLNPVVPPATLAAAPILRIETEPPGAAVVVDGVEAGLSPLMKTTLRPGAHTVKVERAGFAPAQLSFELFAGVSMAPLRFVLQPTSAILNLTAQPPGAVFVDGKPLGAAPLSGTLVDPGPHELRVEEKGFKSWVRKVDAKAGESLDLEALLEPAPRKTAASEPKAAASVAPRAKAHEGDLVELTPDVTEPRKISGDPAAYPEAAARQHLEGSVAIEMIVSEAGVPSELRILESAGEILDKAVLEAVQRWRYEPARKDGVKVRVHWRTRQRFERAR